MANIAQSQGIARRLREVAQLLADQGANRFCGRANRATAGAISVRRGSPVGIDPRRRVVGPLGFLEGRLPRRHGHRHRLLPLSRLPFEHRQARVRAVRTNGARRLWPARCHRGDGEYTKVRKVGRYIVTPLSATIPWPRSGRLWRNRVSTESGEGQTIARTEFPLYNEGGRADP